MTDSRHALPYERVTLDDAGHELASCLDHAGNVGLWYLIPLCCCCEDEADHGDASPSSAPHDQLGPLPERWRSRVRSVTDRPRCGRVTRHGTPCRRGVLRRGVARRQHRHHASA